MDYTTSLPPLEGFGRMGQKKEASWPPFLIELTDGISAS